VEVPSITPQQKRVLVYATAIALIFGAYFLRTFASMVAIAAILAFLFMPVYQRFRRKMSDGAAAALTLLVTLLAILIPLILVVGISIYQINHAINNVSSVVSTNDITQFGKHFIDSVNHFLARFPFINYRLTPESVTTTITTLVQHFASSMLKILTGTLGNFFSLVTSAIIYIYVFTSILRHFDKLLEIAGVLNPLGSSISELYFQRIGAMVKGTVRGQFIIAVCQGFADATFIYIGGLHQAYFVFFLILTALSIIPLGGGILAIPVGILMALFGNFWGGLLVVAGHLLVTTNIDNVLRPKLVPKEVRLDSALMLLSVFAGIGMFGFLGIVIGPVIMIIIVTTLQLYLDTYYSYELKGKAAKEVGLFTQIKLFGSRLLGRNKHHQSK
jgi:predicted PurR-regulated permease PerM